jgi:CRP-like cAMP-binding protein
MNNFNDEGRVYSRLFLCESQFWWASAIFGLNLPANTEATEDSELLCISKHNFLKLITENATISIKIIQILSQCHYKAVMAAEISTQDSETLAIIWLYILTSKDANGYSIDLTW